MSKKISETITENIFREFYGANVFAEKSAISSGYGFTSKKGTSYSGYPDFFCMGTCERGSLCNKKNTFATKEELNNGDSKFDVKEMEVYQIIFK